MAESPYEELIGRIAATTGKTPQDVVAELHRIVNHFDGNLFVEAAEVILAKEDGVAFEDARDPLKREVEERR